MSDSTITHIGPVTLEVPDPSAAHDFYAAAFDLGEHLRFRATDAPTSGFRGYAFSLVVSGPSTVDALVGAATDGGATTIKPASRSFWGYGGVVRAPDGAIWKIASSAKKDTGPATRTIDDIVLLLGATDVAVTKRCYTEHGLTVARSFGRKYVEFANPPGQVKLALYGRRALAKDIGVDQDGSGSHRIALTSTTGPFTDPDGFRCEPMVQTSHADA